MSDMSRYLFKRAILLSGTALNPWALSPDIDIAGRLGRVLGFNGTSEASLLDFLENANASDIVYAINKIRTPEEKYGKLIDVVLGPVVEPSWSKNPFLSRDPVIAARTAWSHSIDVIFGVNSFEGLYLSARGNLDEFIKTMNSNPAYFAPLTTLKLEPSDQKAKIYGQRIKDLYFDNSTGFTTETQLQFFKVCS